MLVVVGTNFNGGDCLMWEGVWVGIVWDEVVYEEKRGK